MAARLNNRHQDVIREKIRASQLVNRIENHILGVEGEGGDLTYPEMSQTQMNGALGLLKKCVPDLKATELSGPGGGSIKLDLPVKYVDSKRPGTTEKTKPAD